jgi:hypothetical protein
MKSTSLSTVFTELIEALSASDPNALRKIALDENHDLLQSVLIEQKALGELLAYCHENIADVDLEQVGWMMVAWAEIGLTWYRNWYNEVCHSTSSDKSEGGAITEKN